MLTINNISKKLSNYRNKKKFFKNSRNINPILKKITNGKKKDPRMKICDGSCSILNRKIFAFSAYILKKTPIAWTPIRP